METIVGIKFKKAGKTYYFSPGELPLQAGDCVVVETARGIEWGEVVTGPKEVPDEEVVQPLKQVMRRLTEEDRATIEDNEQREKDAMITCQEKIDKHALPMKLVDCEYTFDRSKLIFYFTADGRVDFRALVKDLASVFRTRIELRQIGVRDQAKMVGGLGPCGRAMCCATFLGDFHPVSIKMAKEQNLSLNPTKISGICGRLMCCLQYEQTVYEDAMKAMPNINSEVNTPQGKGTVVSCNVIKEQVSVKVLQKDGTPEIIKCTMEEIGYKKSAPKKETPPAGKEQKEDRPTGDGQKDAAGKKDAPRRRKRSRNRKR
jgi:cell fate regulator YaaT (PSP1 superfamily)